MTQRLATLEIHPDQPAEAAVIWMHGLGASFHDFAQVPPVLELDMPVRYVFPQAPSIPVTINGGAVMPAWYDIVSLESRGQDDAGLRRSADAIAALFDRELERGLAADRIVLGGFSMGAAMALFLGLRLPAGPAGIFALSGYLPLAEALATEGSELRAPVFVAHGNRDPLVPVTLGRKAVETLKARGHCVAHHEYPIEHECNLPELQRLGEWLGQLWA